MAKKLFFNDEARKGIERGVNLLVDAVSATLGPKGRNVVIDKGYGSPEVTKDGITVARNIVLDDKLQNIGAQLIREVASKTNDIAGDGTSTSSVLARSLYIQGLRAVNGGTNPIPLKRGFDKGLEAIVEELKKLSRKVEKEDIEHVASISANDPELGKKIAEAVNKAGVDGVITVEEQPSVGIDIDIVEGMRLERGFLSPYFVTNPDKMCAEIDGAKVIVTDEKISSQRDIIPLLDKVLKSGHKDIVIVAEDIEGEALASLVMNKMQGILRVCAIKAPWYGDRKKALMQDLVAVVGGKFISKELGLTLADAELEDLGTARRVTVTKDHATFVDGGGSDDSVKDRANIIRNEIKATDSNYEKEYMQKRLAKLSGGVGVIRVGAATETETREIRQRIEDALSATTAAVEEGIVPGGGIALVRSMRAVDSLEMADDDEKVAKSILKEALTAPLVKIAENSGVASTQGIVEKILNSESDSFGYDASTGEYVDMLERGIIDPTKVTRVALQNAVSIASLLLTTECVIVDIQEESKELDK
jgi:chaperonin GroEL